MHLKRYIEEILAPETAVKAVIGIGSIATGHMTPASDIDAVIFLDPLDLYIAPAEAIWQAEGDTYASIFDDKANGIPLDFTRLAWQEWTDPDFDWPEGYKAELAGGWIAYDPAGEAARLIAERTAYPDDLRFVRLDEAIIWLDQHLNWKPETAWEQLTPAIAFDRLEAAYHYLVAALFAFNRRWRIWRNREMQGLLSLPWLPADFENRVIVAANTPSLDEAGYQARLESLRALFKDLLDQLTATGDYSYTPVDQAFIRKNDEPGRAWNLEEWQKFHVARKTAVTSTNGTN